MSRCRSHERLRSDEGGYTLPEMLMAIVMLMFVLLAVVQISTVVGKSEPELSGYAAKIDRARVLMERLGRELRQSYNVRSVTATNLTFDAWVRRTECGGEVPSSEVPAIRCAVTYT